MQEIAVTRGVGEVERVLLEEAAAEAVVLCELLPLPLAVGEAVLQIELLGALATGEAVKLVVMLPLVLGDADAAMLADPLLEGQALRVPLPLLLLQPVSELEALTVPVADAVLVRVAVNVMADSVADPVALLVPVALTEAREVGVLVAVEEAVIVGTAVRVRAEKEEVPEEVLVSTDPVAVGVKADTVAVEVKVRATKPLGVVEAEPVEEEVCVGELDCAALTVSETVPVEDAEALAVAEAEDESVACKRRAPGGACGSTPVAIIRRSRRDCALRCSEEQAMGPMSRVFHAASAARRG